MAAQQEYMDPGDIRLHSHETLRFHNTSIAALAAEFSPS